MILLVRRLQAGEIDSDGIKTAFWVSMPGKLVKYALLFLAGAVLLGFVLHRLGFRGGGPRPGGLSTALPGAPAAPAADDGDE